MEFGRIEDVSRVDWRLPQDGAGTGGVLAGGSGAGDLRIGMATWSDPGLAERLGAPMTAGGRPKDALGPHARAIPSNELNSTFYGDTRERFERWASAVPAGFLFCPKLPSRITHELVLQDAEGDMAGFVERSSALGEARGPLWFALPPYVGPQAFGDLRGFLERWAPEVELAVEVREPRWFTGSVREDLVSLLRGLGVTWILTDTAGRRDAAHMTLTTPRTFVRFVGNGLHPSDLTRLDAWAERLAAWTEAGLERGFVFMHQRDESLTVELAERLDAALAARGLPVLRPWRECSGFEAPRQQLGLFD